MLYTVIQCHGLISRAMAEHLPGCWTSSTRKASSGSGWACLVLRLLLQYSLKGLPALTLHTHEGLTVEPSLAAFGPSPRSSQAWLTMTPRLIGKWWTMILTLPLFHLHIWQGLLLMGPWENALLAGPMWRKFLDFCPSPVFVCLVGYCIFLKKGRSVDLDKDIPKGDYLKGKLAVHASGSVCHLVHKPGASSKTKRELNQALLAAESAYLDQIENVNDLANNHFQHSHPFKWPLLLV